MPEDVRPLVDHLFRREAARITAVLTRIFGSHNLELVEDVVQDTLLKALEHWKFHGIPANPTAWLFTAARNKALDVVRRERHQREFEASVSPLLKSEYSVGTTLQKLVTPDGIEDEQLRMMFVCCHPSLPEESQVAMVLKTLCGFTTLEIARAFLTNEETITKRLYRGREQFREEKIAFALPPPHELKQRLQNVLTVVYLIFNEGYHATHQGSLVREDLLEEALRLGKMLVDSETTRHTDAFALLALMCFHAARAHGRIDAAGRMLTLKEQDRAKWNRELIEQGNTYIHQASIGDHLSFYHVEAAIAYEHVTAASFAATNWSRILQLYEWLYQIKPDAVVALNRAIARAEAEGPAAALTELLDIESNGQLQNYYLLYASLGEIHARMGNNQMAMQYLMKALPLTKTVAEQDLLSRKIAALNLVEKEN